MLILGGHRTLLLLISSFLFSFMLMSCTDSTASPVKEESNFSVLAKEMRQRQVVLLLEFHAENCPYCSALEEDFLAPMLLNKSYVPKVIIRKIQIDSGNTIVDFKGNSVKARTFAKHYRVNLTPTLLFLNAEGKEISERIIGLNTPSLFGAYIDMGIEKALKNIRAKNAS